MIEEPIVTIIDICHVQIIVSTMSDTKPYLFLANRKQHYAPSRMRTTPAS